ncbi:hypothetical protein [Flavobacterium psychrophilum]|uniref:hypothetical protein n=1 Tax=Flavobacterium psychrophilum TaxID=96345 RepID=UPI001C8F4849|nr:hypothetical protein [Flavobacterium psychrophilum]ELY1977895.1 hypothetical protein [Flavobacterium psychrophilum]QZK98646.1 hypothetical protein K5L05_02870 [Flavobacterium psychrophilum]
MKDNNLNLRSLHISWKNIKYNKLEESDFFLMMNKSSSSIFKKILIISILEFSFSIFISVLLENLDSINMYYYLDNNNILILLNYTYYFIFLFFILKFFVYFKKLNMVSNLKELSKNIIQTRKSVYDFIISNIILFNLNSIAFAYLFLKSNKNYNIINTSNEINYKFELIFYGVLIIYLSIISFFIWYIYKLVYLNLFKRLFVNYKELESV